MPKPGSSGSRSAGGDVICIDRPTGSGAVGRKMCRLKVGQKGKGSTCTSK